MKKNTVLGKLLFYSISISSIIFATVGVVANVIGVVDGIRGYGTLIYSLLKKCFYELAQNWKLIICMVFFLLFIIFFFWMSHKKRIEKWQAHEMTRFSAEQRNTVFFGGENYIVEIKQFLKQKEAPLLWWTVTGVAGIGKTRLMFETLASSEFRNADVHWLENYEDYREEALKRRMDTILASPKLRNIIIADDAQIYMDNIGELITYTACKHSNEIGGHKIRILLLVRIGENDNNIDSKRQIGGVF